jgi:hypothetical protein
VPHGILLVLGFLLLAGVSLLVMYASRRSVLERRVGSFACRVQLNGEARVARTLGVAQYGVGRLVWYRGLSLSPRPVHIWNRSELAILERTRLDPIVGSGSRLVRLRCRCRGVEFNLTVSRAAAAGLTSWTEAGPSRSYRHSV